MTGATSGAIETARTTLLPPYIRRQAAKPRYHAATIAPSKNRRQYPWKVGLLLLAVGVASYYMGLFGSSKTETANTSSGGMAGSDPKSFVDGLIKSEKVVIFSKS